LAECDTLCYNDQNYEKFIRTNRNPLVALAQEWQPMKAMLYMQNKKDPVAVLDEVKVVQMNDNHNQSPYRITFSASQLNSGRTMIELHRDAKMRIRLDDGREASVLLQHTSLDSKGNAVGVLRVLGTMDNA
jgi:hypothetical protein